MPREGTPLRPPRRLRPPARAGAVRRCAPSGAHPTTPRQAPGPHTKPPPRWCWPIPRPTPRRRTRFSKAVALGQLGFLPRRLEHALKPVGHVEAKIRRHVKVRLHNVAPTSFLLGTRTAPHLFQGVGGFSHRRNHHHGLLFGAQVVRQKLTHPADGRGVLHRGAAKLVGGTWDLLTMRCKVGREGNVAKSPSVNRPLSQVSVNDAPNVLVSRSPVRSNQHLPLQALGVHRPRVGGHGENRTGRHPAAPRFGDDQILEVPRQAFPRAVPRGEGPCPRFGLTLGHKHSKRPWAMSDCKVSTVRATSCSARSYRPIPR